MFSATRPRSTLRSKVSSAVDTGTAAPAVIRNDASIDRARMNRTRIKGLLAAYRAEFDRTSEMRLSIQPESYGCGTSAGSPTAYHSSRPNGSENPAIGFQAESALESIPSVSQPFQGKSLSFPVRRSRGELA